MRRCCIALPTQEGTLPTADPLVGASEDATPEEIARTIFGDYTR